MGGNTFLEYERMGGLDIPDPGDAGAIPVDHSGVVNIVTAAAETRTVADPSFVGQRLTLHMQVDGGDATVTFASGINVTANNTAISADANDVLDLVGVKDGAATAGTLAWRIVFNEGWALSTV